MALSRLRAKGRAGIGNEPHVRLYAHELDCPAYRTLAPDARALLVELRALYRPSTGNVVFLSLREAMRRIGVGQRRAQAAFTALIERGWITVETPGGFTYKTRHATSYRLENQAGPTSDAKPSKAYMRWQPEADLEENHDALLHTVSVAKKTGQLK